jgi:putative phage-type endonuclease
MKTRDQWLDEKQHCIGASDWAAILGYDPKRTAHDVWLSKVMGYHRDFDNDLMWWGRVSEENVALWYERKSGRELLNPGATVIRYHRDYPWIGVTLDRVHKDDKSPAEIKTASGKQAGRWQDSQIPIENEIQLQAQIEVCGLPHGTAVGLLWGNDLVWRDREHDKSFISTAIPILERFWHDNVIARVPPTVTSPMSLGAVKKIYPHDNGETIDLSETQQSRVIAFENAKASLKEIKKCVDEQDAEIRQMIGDNTFGAMPNGNILEARTVRCKNGTTYRKLKVKK